MTEEDRPSSIEEQLENMKLISDRDAFEILSVLAKVGPTSFSQLKSRLNLNPNSLSKSLKQLLTHDLVKNYYEKKEDARNYSFYRITRKCQDILHLNVAVPRISELLRQFKNHCLSKGWRISERDDWIQTDSGYHIFLWTRKISPSSFKAITANRKCVIREGLSYRVVEASYTAWLFSESPTKTVIKTFFKNPDFSKRAAIYDLSQSYLSKPNIKIFNNTESRVFKEFEDYLMTLWNLRFPSIRKIENVNYLRI